MTKPDFLPGEYETRLEGAQQAMHAENLDALFFTTEAEMLYFTGFRTLFWQSPTRPWFLVVPLAGKPIAVIPEIGAALMRTTWIDDIRSWSSPHLNDDGITLLASVLANYARVGMPMGRETTLRMPLANYHRLREILHTTEFVDAGPLVQALRMIKSPAEVSAITTVCSIASSAFDRANELFHEGQSLFDVFRAFRQELLQQGAEEVPYLVGGAGQGGYSDVISPPDDRALRAGDVLMLDTGASRKGYFCDFDRNFAIGHASDTAQAANQILYRATEAALTAARPGVRCSDLYRIMSDVIDQGSGDVGRFGHGLGIQLTEAPSVISWDNTELRPGMVMTLEPGMVVGEGQIMVHEENIVITDGPPQLLTKRAPQELPVI